MSSARAGRSSAISDTSTPPDAPRMPAVRPRACAIRECCCSPRRSEPGFCPRSPWRSRVWPGRSGHRESEATARLAGWEHGPVGEEVRRALLALRRVVVRLNAALREKRLPPDPLEDELAGAGSQPAQAAWRASAIMTWAAGRAWGSVTTRHHIPDGDLQRLAWQAAEILAQLEDLPRHPLSAPARDARASLLRPPVL